MGDLTEFQTGMRLFLKAYPWRRIDPVPWTPLRRPLAVSIDDNLDLFDRPEYAEDD